MTEAQTTNEKDADWFAFNIGSWADGVLDELESEKSQ